MILSVVSLAESGVAPLHVENRKLVDWFSLLTRNSPSYARAAKKEKKTHRFLQHNVISFDKITLSNPMGKHKFL